MSHSSLSRIERGEYGYDQEHLEKLAEVYQTKPGDLLNVNPLSGRAASRQNRGARR
jgi:transcriptional regulator with XRE-family HTH domain